MNDSDSSMGGTIVGSVLDYSVPMKEIFSSIQGEGEFAGRRQIFIRLTGCNLNCSYCDTEYAASDCWKVESYPGSGEFTVQHQLPTLKNITDLVESWCSSFPNLHHSITITGGEPLLHTDCLINLLPQLRGFLPVYLETNGALPDELLKIVSMVDGISMDIKLPSTACNKEDLWDAHSRFLSVAAAVRTSVKMVVSDATSMDEILQGCNIIKNVDKNIPLFLQPLTSRDGTVAVSAPYLLRLQASASTILPDVRVIPQMHLMMGAL